MGGEIEASVSWDGVPTIRLVDWNFHAAMRCEQRELSPEEIEAVVRSSHFSRLPNLGRADWRTFGRNADGKRFVVLFDCPVAGDSRRARVVTMWVER